MEWNFLTQKFLLKKKIFTPFIKKKYYWWFTLKINPVPTAHKDGEWKKKKKKKKKYIYIYIYIYIKILLTNIGIKQMCLWEILKSILEINGFAKTHFEYHWCWEFHCWQAGGSIQNTFIFWGGRVEAEISGARSPGWLNFIPWSGSYVLHFTLQRLETSGDY